jgi:hypothetical protein
MSLMMSEDFQYVLRILNTNVDGRQKVMYAMCATKGIGRRLSNLICKKADIDLNKRAFAELLPTFEWCDTQLPLSWYKKFPHRSHCFQFCIYTFVLGSGHTDVDHQCTPCSHPYQEGSRACSPPPPPCVQASLDHRVAWAANRPRPHRVAQPALASCFCLRFTGKNGRSLSPNNAYSSSYLRSKITTTRACENISPIGFCPRLTTVEEKVHNFCLLGTVRMACPESYGLRSIPVVSAAFGRGGTVSPALAAHSPPLPSPE